MVVLDTTVVSELMRLSSDPAVEAWTAGHPAASLFFSAVGEAELRYGVAIMPAGRRRDRLAAEIEAMLRDDFEGRVLPFDSDAARFYAQIAASRRAAGRSVSQTDCQIAAIARAHGMAVATRNVRDFVDAGIDVIDPWDGA
ncbi:MAG: type II toxin-antitoxin system VapC family toxin [Nitrospira sp. SB0677_bin_15]|nr:type II toxin-antitoxin system VapC family toxin [Nitrospira sp. SB0677_bin_15]